MKQRQVAIILPTVQNGCIFLVRSETQYFVTVFADRYVGEVMEFTVDIVRTQVCTTHCGEIDMIFNFKDFGKIVFLTREEAEKALERTKDE